MHSQLGRFSFLVGAGIGLFGALIHWVAPFLGPDWYAFLTSPQWVVASARNGGWEAPLGAAVVGGLMFACFLYALAGVGLMRGMPLLRTALCTISAVCLVRGLLLVPFLLKVPEKLSAFDIVGSLVWFTAGLGFLFGTVSGWATLKPAGRTGDLPASA